MSSIKVRVITSFAIIAIVIPPLVLGGIWLDLLAAFIVLSGGYELLGLSENVRKWPKWLIPMEILFVWALLFGVSEKLAFPLLGVMVLLAMSMPVISKAVDGRDVFLLSVYLCIFYLFGMSFLKLYAKDPLYFGLWRLRPICVIRQLSSAAPCLASISCVRAFLRKKRWRERSAGGLWLASAPFCSHAVWI